jgi:hypothetical protein
MGWLTNGANSTDTAYFAAHGLQTTIGSVQLTSRLFLPYKNSEYYGTITLSGIPKTAYDPPITFCSMIMAPNPATTTVELTYDAFEGEEFSIFAVNLGNSQLSLLCNSMYAENDGENEYEVSVNSLSNGTYAIFLIGIENNYYETLVKQ